MDHEDIQKLTNACAKIAHDAFKGQFGNINSEQWIPIGNTAAVLLEKGLEDGNIRKAILNE
jgi:hypothetical protein